MTTHESQHQFVLHEPNDRDAFCCHGSASGERCIRHVAHQSLVLRGGGVRACRSFVRYRFRCFRHGDHELSRSPPRHPPPIKAATRSPSARADTDDWRSHAQCQTSSRSLSTEEIDRRLDEASVPAGEERARRKRRLTKGPSEFRDMRGDIPPSRRAEIPIKAACNFMSVNRPDLGIPPASNEATLFKEEARQFELKQQIAQFLHERRRA